MIHQDCIRLQNFIIDLRLSYPDTESKHEHPMMSPVYKIKLFFVAAVLLMLGSHALLPHHHHFDSHFSHNQRLPVDSSHENSESPAFHCHAFNHLLDNGYHHKLIKFIQYQPFLAPVISEGLPSIGQHTIIKWKTPDIHIAAQGYDHFYSLRDPPALS